MKKLIYLIMIMGIFFTGCDPMDDINTVLDAQENPVVGDATYTLTDDDYDDLGLSFGNFSSVDDAKTALPPFLTDMFPVWGKGSSAIVGYNLYIGNAEGVSDYSGADQYYLSKADYALSGSDVLGFYPGVNTSDYLGSILTTSIAAPTDGQIALARYVQYKEVPVVTITTNYSLEDNFNYGTVADNLTTVSGGEWEAHSGAGNGPVGYETSSFSMTDYPSSGIGGSLTIDGSASEDVTNWFSEISSGTVYASALVNLSAVSTGTYFFHVRDGDFNYRARVGAMDDGSGKILFGIGASSSTLTYGTTPFNLDTTYLLVASYNIDDGTSNLYVLTAAEATEPASPEAASSGNSGAIISGVSIRQGFGGPTGTLDGVRVATSWDAIMVNDVAELVEGDKMNTEIFYTYSDGDWDVTDEAYFIQDADFDSMGEGSGQPGRFNNFGSSTPAEDYLPTFLSLTEPWAYGLEGDEVIMVYDYFSSSSGAQIRGNRYTVINGDWVPHTSVISTTLQFGHDGAKWVPDNTIKYRITTADIALIDSALSGNPDFTNATANVSQFGSFDRRSSSGNYWSDDMLVTAFNIVLDNLNPNAEEGQKYILTFATYIGAVVDEDLSLIKTGGEWVINE